jgi:type IV secretion system protein TrbG
MTIIRIALLAVAALPLLASAQATPPALPAPTADTQQQLLDVQRQVAESQRRLQEAQERGQQVGGRVVPPATPAAPIVPSITQAAAAAPAPSCAGCNAPMPTPSAVAAPKRRVPSRSTPDEVRRLEARLLAMKSELKVDQARDAATAHAATIRSIRARQIFDFADGGIYEILAAVDHNTYIELQPGEKIVDPSGKPSAGDTVRWLVETSEYGKGQDKRVVVILKPREVDLETNMAINTDRRAYYLTIKSNASSYMQAVAWNYPYDEARAQLAATASKDRVEQSREAIATRPEALRFGYAVKGADVPWKPLRAFDDGVKTYVQMPAAMHSYEAPALFVIEDGKPLLVNYRVKGDYYIVDRLFDHAQLRVGTDKAVDVTRNSVSANTTASAGFIFPWD